MRARDREPAARQVRVLRLRLRSPGWPGSQGSSSVEYGLIIALIGAVLCIGIGLSVKSMFDGVVQCFVANMQGASDATCQPPPGGGGGGGGGGIVPGSTKPPPTPTVTPTPTTTPTP